jgi:hypothetical protein
LIVSLRTAQAKGTYERRLQYLNKMTLLSIADFSLKPLLPRKDKILHGRIA